jgi:hypothetical protein
MKVHQNIMMKNSRKGKQKLYAVPHLAAPINSTSGTRSLVVSVLAEVYRPPAPLAGTIERANVQPLCAAPMWIGFPRLGRGVNGNGAGASDSERRPASAPSSGD